MSVFDAQSCGEDLRRIEAVAKADVEGDDLDQLETCPSHWSPTRCWAECRLYKKAYREARKVCVNLVQGLIRGNAKQI